MGWVRRIAIGTGAVFLLLAGAGILFMGPRNLAGLLRYGIGRTKEGALRVGDRAPDVPLVALDGVTRLTLVDHVGPKPLVLILGSYT